MKCALNQKNIEEFKSTSILPQTSYWAQVKSEHGYIPKGFELTISKDVISPDGSPNEIKAEDLMVLIKYIDQNTCFAYVPYGPKTEPSFENQGVLLEQLSQSIQAHLPSNCIFIRYDLAWENQWAREDEYFDSLGNWIGPPTTKIQEYRVNFNTQHWNLVKSNADSLPKNTFFLDLTLSEKELLYNMRYNTRYNVRKAKKKGVQVKEYDSSYLEDWYHLYLETARRQHMPVKEIDYFRSILDNQDNNRKGVTVKMLMANLNGKFLSSMFLALSKERGTYLYGASTSGKNRFMASYALQWESIKIAKAWGCKEYDMFGSAPNLNKSHPLHGVHVYKKGFGGDLFHRMGCWDYPYDDLSYQRYRLKETMDSKN